MSLSYIALFQPFIHFISTCRLVSRHPKLKMVLAVALQEIGLVAMATTHRETALVHLAMPMKMTGLWNEMLKAAA
jgi:hypothetical protein